jgi:hypothetical protein
MVYDMVVEVHCINRVQRQFRFFQPFPASSHRGRVTRHAQVTLNIIVTCTSSFYTPRTGNSKQCLVAEADAMLIQNGTVVQFG